MESAASVLTKRPCRVVVPCEIVVVWCGELDSSESRQYITPLCETWMLGAQPIPSLPGHALSSCHLLPAIRA